MLKPLNGHVVIKPEVKEEKTASGIFLPDTAAKEKPQVGYVVAVSEYRETANGTRVATEVKVGEKVVFAKYIGTELHLDGEDYLILRETDILAVI